MRQSTVLALGQSALLLLSLSLAVGCGSDSSNESDPQQTANSSDTDQEESEDNAVQESESEDQTSEKANTEGEAIGEEGEQVVGDERQSPEDSHTGSSLDSAVRVVEPSHPASVESGPVSTSIQRLDSADEEVKIGVQFVIAEGWHTYASVGPTGVSPVTSVEFRLPEGVTLQEPITRPAGKPYLEDPGSTIYTDTVMFEGRVNRPGHPFEVIAVLKFQSCDHERCNLPETVRLSLVVEE